MQACYGKSGLWGQLKEAEKHQIQYQGTRVIATPL